MRHPGAAVLAILVAACGATARTAPDSADSQARKLAAKRGRELVQEVYTSLRRGDVDGLITIVSPTVFAAGPEGEQLFVDRGDLLVALGGPFAPGKRHKVSSRDLVVVGSPGGKAAWATDRLELDGKKYWISAILAEVDDIWVVTSLHVTRRAGAAKGLPPLTGGVEPGASEPATLFRAVATRPAAAADQLSDRKEILVAGLGLAKPTRGAKAVKKAWKKLWKKGEPEGTPVEGNLRATVSADGTLAFVCGNLVTTRTCMTYEHDGGWRLVAVTEH